MTHPLPDITGGGVHDLYCSRPPEGDCNVLASRMGSCLVYIESMMAICMKLHFKRKRSCPKRQHFKYFTWCVRVSSSVPFLRHFQASTQCDIDHGIWFTTFTHFLKVPFSFVSSTLYAIIICFTIISVHPSQFSMFQWCLEATLKSDGLSTLLKSAAR